MLMKTKIFYAVGGLLILGVFGITVNMAGNLSNLAEKVNFLAAGSGEQMVGGTTNFDTLELGGALTVTGAFGVTGDLTAGTADVSRFTWGGAILATSTTNGASATGVLTEAQLIAYNGIDMTLTDSMAHTLTLPATSTMTTMIPNAGDTFDLHYRVIGTAATASSTIAAGTGIDLVENENGDVEIEAGNEAWLRFIREADTDVTVTVDEYIAAD